MLMLIYLSPSMLALSMVVTESSGMYGRNVSTIFMRTSTTRLGSLDRVSRTQATVPIVTPFSCTSAPGSTPVESGIWVVRYTFGFNQVPPLSKYTNTERTEIEDTATMAMRIFAQRSLWGAGMFSFRLYRGVVGVGVGTAGESRGGRDGWRP